MKIKSTVSLRKIADEYIIFLNENNTLDYTNAITLNETAAYLIEQTGDKEFGIEDWVTLLTEKYEVSPEQALQDVENIIKTYREIGLLA